MKDYQALATVFTETQLNDPVFFTAEGDKDLVSAYYLFHAVMRYYKEDSSLSPSPETVYTSALKEAAKIRSADIKDLMLDHLITNAVSRTNDPVFLGSLPPGFLKTPKEKYFRDIIHAKLELLKAAGANQPTGAFLHSDGSGGKAFFLQ
jgi:hypothetical protein